MTSWNRAVRDRRFWGIAGIVFFIRAFPLALALGAGLPLKPDIGTPLALAIMLAVFTASRYLFNRFVVLRLLSAYERRKSPPADA
jgi:hypothetical protein